MHQRILTTAVLGACALFWAGLGNAQAFLFSGVWQPTSTETEYFSFPLPLFQTGADFYMYMFDLDDGTADNLMLLDPDDGYAAQTYFAQNGAGDWEVFLDNPAKGAEAKLNLGGSSGFGLFFDNDADLTNGFSTLYDVVELQNDSFALFPLFGTEDVLNLLVLQGDGGAPEDFAALVDAAPLTAVPVPGPLLLLGAGLLGLSAPRLRSLRS